MLVHDISAKRQASFQNPSSLASMNPSSSRIPISNRVRRRKHGQSSSRRSPAEIGEVAPQEPQSVASEVHCESDAVVASGNGSTEDEVQFIEESPAPVEASATGDVSCAAEFWGGVFSSFFFLFLKKERCMCVERFCRRSCRHL